MSSIKDYVKSKLKKNTDNPKTFKEMKKDWRKYCEYFKSYPDRFIDFISPPNSKIKLFFYQRVYLRALFRYRKVFITATRGTSKCLSGDSIVFTEDGMKEIGSFSNYEKEEREFDINENIVDGFNKVNKSKVAFSNGFRKTKLIRTSDGYQVEGTLNHPVMVMNENGNFDYKNIGDIRKGDYVAIGRNANVFGKRKIIGNIMDDYDKDYNTISYKYPKEMSEDLARYMGLLIGDGCLKVDRTIIFTTNDKELEDFFKNKSIDFFGKSPMKYDSCVYDQRLNSKFIREYLYRIGLGYGGSSEKYIPETIMEAPRKIVASFLRGYFDADGGVDKNLNISLSTSSEKMSKQLQTILLNFGIISNRSKNYSKKFGTYHWKITMLGHNAQKYYEEIGFGLSRKQNRLKEITNRRKNSNKDIIPFQGERVKRVCETNKKNNSKLLKRAFEHVRTLKNNLTYSKIKKFDGFNILHDNDMAMIKGYQELNYYWDKVDVIEDSENYVYDITVNKNHSYYGNGFINHNSYTGILSMYLKCIMFPESKFFIVAPQKEQAAKISQEKIEEIWSHFPILKREIRHKSFTNDYTKLVFHNGSVFDVVQAKDSARGGRKYCDTY